jgi:hypothetical protein
MICFYVRPLHTSVHCNTILIFYLNFFLLQLSNAGGRIIIASDGVWDDLSFEMALECSRGYPSDIAANRIVNVTILLSFPLVDRLKLLPPHFVIYFLLICRRQSYLED